MIVDTHAHFWTFAEDVSADSRQALESAIKKPERLDIRYAEFSRNVASVDRVFVLGLRAKFCGFNVPNESLAEFVSDDPQKYIGMMGLDPADEDMVDQLERGRTELGLKGIVLSPDLASFDPRDARLKEVYQRASKYGLPIFIHSGQFRIARAALKHASPMLLDDVVRTFPGLRIVICHAGRPFLAETIALMHKHEGVYADLAGVVACPYELFSLLQLAHEYDVLSRLLFATDYPFTVAREDFVRVQRAGDASRGTGLPELSEAALNEIIHRNVFKQLGIPLDILNVSAGE